MDAYKKQPERTKQMFVVVPIFIVLYVLHTFLPSYASARAFTFLQFNLVMALVSLDLMLCTMSARPFMAFNPAFLLLVVPLVAFFGVKVSP